MTISGGSALPKDEIERMVREAEEHAEEDKTRREETEARNTAEQLVYSTEKFLADSADKIPADGRGEVDEALKDLKEALKEGSEVSPADITAKATRLSEESQKLGTAMYAAASAAESAPGAESDESNPGSSSAGPDKAAEDDDVVDAEVVDETEGDSPASGDKK
ncbi:MAG: Hsp70 family protein, partial [Actinomycetota bacterium]